MHGSGAISGTQNKGPNARIKKFPRRFSSLQTFQGFREACDTESGIKTKYVHGIIRKNLAVSYINASIFPPRRVAQSIQSSPPPSPPPPNLPIRLNSGRSMMEEMIGLLQAAGADSRGDSRKVEGHSINDGK